MTQASKSFLSKANGRALIVLTVLLTVGTMGFYFLELRDNPEYPALSDGEGLFTSLWWAVVTLTTVGYGDYVPKSVEGRFLGMLLMFSGMGTVSFVAASLTGHFVEQGRLARKGLVPVHVKGHIIVINWNSSGIGLVRSLAGARPQAQVVVAAELPEEVRDGVAVELGLGERLLFVQGEPAKAGIIEKAKPHKASLAYILARDDLSPREADNHSMHCALTLRAAAPNLKVLAEAYGEESRALLLNAGVRECLGRGGLSSFVLSAMGVAPPFWELLKAINRGLPKGQLAVRELSAEDRAKSWPELVASRLALYGELPLAASKGEHSITFEGLLSGGGALDAFVLDLARSSQAGPLGQARAELALHPVDLQNLEGFDSIVVLTRLSGQEKAG